ncbi:reverse transcriptase domain-containing protein [Tanacetum coccineum]
MLVKKFNSDLNDRLNLSFKLPSLDSQLYITDDEDVKFFVGCASNVMEGGHENVMPTQEYVIKIIEDAFEDDHFTRGPWLSVVVYLHAKGVMAAGCLSDMKKYCKNRKLETVVGVIMSRTPNALGDLTITLKDPSGTMGGTIHYKVFKEEEGYAKSINVRAVLILRNVSVFTPKPSNHYLNITLRNIVKVFDKETIF